MPGIPASLARQVRSALRPLMVLTYTRTPLTTGIQDAHYNETSVEGTPATGQPCAYLESSRLVVDDAGRRTIGVPTLYVPHDDPLAIGDQVSAITGRDGVVVQAGPFVVETIDPAAEAGASTLKIAVLHRADPVRSE